MRLGAMTEKIDFNDLYFRLLHQGFVWTHDDGKSLVVRQDEDGLEIEIFYHNDFVTKIECNSKYREKFLPLTFGQLNAFILSIKVKRPEHLIKN